MEMNVVGRILNLFFRALRNWATSDIDGNDFFKFVTPIEVEMLVKFCFSKKYEILEKQKILLIDDEMEDSNNILFLKCILSNFDWTIKVNNPE